MMASDPINLKSVAVYPAERMTALAPLLEVLATLFPVRFVAHHGDMPRTDGLFSVDAATDVAERAFSAGMSVLSMAEISAGTPLRPLTVGFVGSPCVQPYLRELQVTASIALSHQWSSGDSDGVIAVADGKPLWTERHQGRQVLRQVASGVPSLGKNQPVFPELLHGGWVRWLPLFHFLRELTADVDWQPNGLRACFMFDDPNLHWSSWGFLNYRDLVAHARQHHYHVSMATVPLDMWFTHSRTAAFFREQSRHLSLLVHGIEHTHAELQRPNSTERRMQDLLWSLQKVQELEKRHGLRISRVMAPPHHACSIAAANLMLRAGYEAACVAWLLLMRSNPHVQWRPDFGLQPAEFLGEGFPVLPRFNFANQDPGRAVLAAFFRQPIIMIGHHQDVAGGLEVLADWAQWVNSFGAVRWADLEEIIQSNYLTRQVNGTLFIKLGAHRIRLAIPDGVNQIVLLRPWITADQLEDVRLTRQGRVSQLPVVPGAEVGPCPVSPGEELTVQCGTPIQAPPPMRAAPLRIWPVTRRLACEGRDRLMPLFGKGRRTVRPRPLSPNS